jgi:hypothetical protein
MPRRLLPLAAGLPLIAALLACTDSTGPVEGGEFEAQVSGEYSLELQGRASFGVFPGEGFGLNLQPASGSHILAIARRTEARPAVGTYVMTSPDEAGGYYAVFISQGASGPITFASQQGELVITESSATRLSGTFQFAAQEYRGPNQTGDREIWVVGSFTAPCTPGARCN